MKDLGQLSYFLGIAVTHHASGWFLSQKKYAMEIIDRAGMSSCKSSPTPVDTKPKLNATSSTPFEDPTLYRSLAGALQYLTFTRPSATGVLIHAWPKGWAHASSQVHIALHLGYYRPWWSSSLSIIYIHSCFLYGCWLGWMPGYETVYFWVLCISWW